MIAHKLKGHIDKCPDRNAKDPIYFELNANARGCGQGKEKMSLEVMMEGMVLSLFLEKVEVFYEAVGGREAIRRDIGFDRFPIEPPKDGWGKKWLKMATQNEAIIGAMEHVVGIDNERIYLEFGAGNGKLSQCVNKYFETDHILIDFSAFNHKAKPVHREGHFWESLRIDIKDLLVRKIPQVEENPGRELVAFSKHLCGVATDLTLECIRNDIKAEGDRWNSAFIALCCHHKCKWEEYPNKEFFTNNDFTESDFKIIQKMTSWATYYANKDRTNSIDDWTNLTITEKETIGRKCKELIDIGRLNYLRAQGHTCTLQTYVPPSISPENTLLIIQFQPQ